MQSSDIEVFKYFRANPRCLTQGDPEGWCLPLAAGPREGRPDFRSSNTATATPATPSPAAPSPASPATLAPNSPALYTSVLLYFYIFLPLLFSFIWKINQSIYNLCNLTSTYLQKHMQNFLSLNSKLLWEKNNFRYREKNVIGYDTL